MLNQPESFSLTFRFIDDLHEKNIWKIHPMELKENQNNKSANFLDLNMKIQNSRFQIKSYDKRDDFDFDIIRMT